MSELNLPTFESLDLKTNNKTNKLTICGKEIEITQYLPVEDKGSLVSITLQRSLENGVFNPLKEEIFFNLHIVYMYTNLVFTDEEKSSPFELYDKLESNGLISTVLTQVPKSEYDFLLDSLHKLEKDMAKYNNSVAGILESVISSLPANAKAAAEIVEQFDPQKYLEVIDFAKSVGFSK